MYDETLNVLKFSAVAQKVCNFLIWLHLRVRSLKNENYHQLLSFMPFIFVYLV